MRANVKPLTHWIIYKKYTVRFRTRDSHEVTGILTTPQGELDFRYEPGPMIIHLQDDEITINEFGWEVERSQDASD